MKTKLVSFYKNDLDPTIASLQKEAFSRLNLELHQVGFNGTHGQGINDYLDSAEFDRIVIFDVDCIPLTTEPILLAEKIVNNKRIYGNAQVSNSFPYAAPSFISFTKELYETSTHKRFEGQFYPNPEGESVEADCGEVFVKENMKRGIEVVLSYPTSCPEVIWSYQGSGTYPQFKYGNATLFDNNTYHQFQIRFKEQQENFIKYVQTLLSRDS